MNLQRIHIGGGSPGNKQRDCVSLQHGIINTAPSFLVICNNQVASAFKFTLTI